MKQLVVQKSGYKILKEKKQPDNKCSALLCMQFNDSNNNTDGNSNDHDNSDSYKCYHYLQQ